VYPVSCRPEWPARPAPERASQPDAGWGAGDEVSLPGRLHLSLAPVLAPLAGALAVLAWRIRETQRPLTRRSMVLPPLAMSTGLAMFLAPGFRVPWSWALGAFLAGGLVRRPKGSDLEP
jgi:hypothetical protein